MARHAVAAVRGAVDGRAAVHVAPELVLDEEVGEAGVGAAAERDEPERDAGGDRVALAAAEQLVGRGAGDLAEHHLRSEPRH